MKKAVLGMSVAAVLATAAWANDTEDTKLAAADPTVKAFTKLDADADGRVSAIEAANDTKVAAGFTRADEDKDGYLSKEEFAMVRSAEGSESATPQ
jgi:Ca2+-binding EF-hand superfamily protein